MGRLGLNQVFEVKVAELVIGQGSKAEASGPQCPQQGSGRNYQYCSGQYRGNFGREQGALTAQGENRKRQRKQAHQRSAQVQQRPQLIVQRERSGLVSCRDCSCLRGREWASGL